MHLFDIQLNPMVKKNYDRRSVILHYQQSVFDIDIILAPKTSAFFTFSQSLQLNFPHIPLFKSISLRAVASLPYRKIYSRIPIDGIEALRESTNTIHRTRSSNGLAPSTTVPKTISSIYINNYIHIYI